MIDENSGVPTPPGPASEAQPTPTARWSTLNGPLFLLMAGVLALSVLSVFERRAQDAQPWSRAILAADGEPLWEGTTPIHVRPLPAENHSAFDSVLANTMNNPAVKEQLPPDILPMTEKIVGVDLTDEVWAPLLASGRPPRPGENEAVAGYLARSDSFVVDGETYRVVGRLWPGVAGLGNTYVIAYEKHQPLFSDEKVATKGWLEPNGLQAEHADALNRFEQHRMRLIGGAAPNGSGLVSMAILVLAVMAGAGSVAHIRLLRILAGYPNRYFGPILNAALAWPRMFAIFHVFFYACVIGAMSAALVFPRMNLLLTEVFQWTFSKGSLSAIGSAYESGSILRAAWATFSHNFFVATVDIAILPSLVMFFSGFVINAVRFCVVGLGLSPIFAGSITHFSYHSITMVLELEAYIIASFFIVLWPFQLFIGVVSGNVWKEWRKGAEIVASGTMLVGVMLAIAALYEATTLILFR